MPTLKFNQFLELKNTKNESIQDETIQNEPDYDNDAFIEATGSDYNVSCFGKFIKTVDEVSDGLELIKLELKKSPNFFPNIWFVSDHGNIDPIDLEGNIIKESKLNNIENKERLLPEIVEILNKQIANELESSQIYRGMSCWLDGNNWIEASKYFFNAADEELEHMRKIYNYLFEKNCTPKVPVISEVKQDFRDIKEIIELSLEHEILVSNLWEKIANLAKEKEDNFTFNFSQWFIDEQNSEEDKFRNLLFKINLEIPNWELDKLFSTYAKN